MENTVNYNLKKPSEADEVLISDLNHNSDIIDTELDKIDTTVKSLDISKVDKTEGKGLSSNDFTDEYKNKVDDTETTAVAHIRDSTVHITQAEKDKLNNISKPNLLINTSFKIRNRPWNKTLPVNTVFYDSCDRWGFIQKGFDGIGLSDPNYLVPTINNRVNNEIVILQGLEPNMIRLFDNKKLTFSVFLSTTQGFELNENSEITISIYTGISPAELLCSTGKKEYSLKIQPTDLGLLGNSNIVLPKKFHITTETITNRPSSISVAIKFKNINNNIYVSNPKLEIGDVATEYQPKAYGEELRDCQRYYRETPFMHSGFSSPDGNTAISWGIVNTNMRIMPNVSVKSLLNPIDAGKIDLIKMFGSGSSILPNFVMSNVGISRVILLLPAGFNGMQGILIEDAEIY